MSRGTEKPDRDMLPHCIPRRPIIAVGVDACFGDGTVALSLPSIVPMFVLFTPCGRSNCHTIYCCTCTSVLILRLFCVRALRVCVKIVGDDEGAPDDERYSGGAHRRQPQEEGGGRQLRHLEGR